MEYKITKINEILGLMDSKKYFETPVGTKIWTRVAHCDYSFEPNIRLRLTKVSQILTNIILIAKFSDNH